MSKDNLDESEIKNALKRMPPKPLELDGVSTGSTLLNLACSGLPNFGFLKGHYHFFVGDSKVGKTWVALTCLAEACKNTKFGGYRLIFDNAEDGALMDIEHYFGRKVADRLEPPEMDVNEPKYSTTIEEFYYHLDDAFAEEKPFIYVMDSMDSLSSEEEIEKFAKQKQAHSKQTEAAGSYGASKAKMNSAGLRQILPKLRDSGSILIIISQTRDNLGFGFEKNTRSGGRALRFYATIEMWASVKEKIERTIKGKKRHLGNVSQIKVKKNRITGKERTVEIPIYHSIGIDDLGSCVDYLLGENHWKKVKSSVEAEEFDFKGTEESLIKKIEQEGLEEKLRNLVAGVWNSIEEASCIHRKKRYE